MKLHRDLSITQKSAWHLAHRLRQALATNGGLFCGPAEVDETYFGGKRKNMPKSKRKGLEGRGGVGKAVVAGIKDRATNKVRAQVVTSPDAENLQGFVREHARRGAVIYTDEHGAYRGMTASSMRRSITRSVNTFAGWSALRASSRFGRC